MRLLEYEFLIKRWHTVCSLFRQRCLKRLASRGGRIPTSTGIRFWGVSS